MMTQAPSTKILVESRFPLELKRSIDSIRELYEIGKQQRWNPETDIAWPAFKPEHYDAATRDAARLVWSRRAWIEYSGLAETPAILIRLCLEAGRESDPKYFLTVRNTEEAWQIESAHRFAQLLGGYVDQPASAQQKALFNQYRHRQALDAEQHADAFFTTHSAVEDGLELQLHRAYLANATDSVAHQLLEKSVQAKERHVAFGWLYVTECAARWSDADRAAIGAHAHQYLQDIELMGYHCPSLGAPDGDEARAAEIAAQAGLGAVSRAVEQGIFIDYVASVRARLDEFGVALPALVHPTLGQL